MAFDPELNLLYVGTGNGGAWKRQRPDDHSDNLYVSSIVALNPATGRVVWHYQTTPGDMWDYTATNSIILADICPSAAKPRKVLLRAPKNGFFYVLDRKTGELLSAEKYGAVNWASHVDLKTGRPCADTLGGVPARRPTRSIPTRTARTTGSPCRSVRRPGLAYILPSTCPGSTARSPVSNI